MGSFVETEIHGGVATVTLNRPEKRNALTREIIHDLTSAMDTLAGNDAVRVLVLRGAGSVFCAGMDLGQMRQRAEAEDSEAEWHRDSVDYCELLCRIYELPVPTIAAVQGPALAGGVGLVVACDIVLAARSAFFALPEPARGITAAMVTPLLVHRVGYGVATAMLLSGDRVSAHRAAELGLVYAVADDDGFDVLVDEASQRILASSPAALFTTKKHIDQCAGGQMTRQLRQSAEVSAKARQTEGAREGLQAFLEKRKPSWQSH